MSLGTHSLGLTSLGLTYGANRINYGFLLFDYVPTDGGEMLTEVLGWRTGVMESQSGIEQRRAFRSKPRRQLKYSMTLSGKRAFDFEALAYGGSGYKFAVPVWTDVANLTTALAEGDNRVNVDVTNRGFVVGGYAVIYQDETRYELVRIESFGAGYFNMTQGAFYNWPQGARVYPLVFAYLETPVNLKWFSGNIYSTDITLNVVDEDSPQNLPDVAASTTYQGLEVLQQRGNWLGDMSLEIRTDSVPVDSGSGVFGQMFFKKHSRVTCAFRWFLDSREKIQFFREFIARRMGQLRPFWLARPYLDFTLQNNVASNAVECVFANSGYAAYVGLNKGRDHIEIRLNNGQVYRRGIVGVSIVSGNTNITLDAPLGVAITPTDVAQISFLTKYRLAADQVTLPWWTTDFADPETYFVSVI